jgi:hypothetical protein
MNRLQFPPRAPGVTGGYPFKLLKHVWLRWLSRAEPGAMQEGCAENPFRHGPVQAPILWYANQTFAQR